jgi:hypothetical protein
VSVFEGGIDAHLVLAVLQRQHLVMGKTKPPVFFVIGRPVRNPFRMVRNCVKAPLEFSERQRSMHG